MNRDQFVQTMVKGRMPAKDVIETADQIGQYQDTKSKNAGEFLLGLGAILAGIVLLPLELPTALLTWSPWPFFLFGQGSDLMGSAKRGDVPDAWRASNAQNAFLDYASAQNPCTEKR